MDVPTKSLPPPRMDSPGRAGVRPSASLTSPRSGIESSVVGFHSRHGNLNLTF